MKKLIAVLALCVIAASAADISGNWKATAEGPNGAMERTFTFKVDGNKVTGKTVSSLVGESTITDGRIEGDTVTFTIDVKFGDQEMKLNYEGKISGDTIRFTVDAAGNTIEWNAKRVS